MSTTGLGHFSPRQFPPNIYPGENANGVVEVEDGMAKQYLLNISWIYETILCKLEAGLMKEVLAMQRKRKIMTTLAQKFI